MHLRLTNHPAVWLVTDPEGRILRRASPEAVQAAGASLAFTTPLYPAAAELPEMAHAATRSLAQGSTRRVRRMR